MAAWRTVFGHDEPYPEQQDGIETVLDTARDRGFTVLEGACGTGKTMLALTAGISLVRDPDSHFERVVVLTSVKQQLRQFEADLQTINAGLPTDVDPVSAVTLVGKADVCPYSREQVADVDPGNVYERCDGLRERTRGLTESVGGQELASAARSQQIGLSDGGGSASYLETAGTPTPYPPETGSHEDTEYCPFYAQYLADLPEDGDASEAIPFDLDGEGMVDADRLVELSVEYGTCPHSMMGAVLGEVEVVVGNYYHAFDPMTVETFTGGVIDDGSFVVCDEAHMLEPRVRDLVSDGVADRSLRRTETELSRVVQALEGGDQVQTGSDVDLDALRGVVQQADVSAADLDRVRRFVRAVRDELDRRVSRYLEREHPGWRSAAENLEDAEIPLRDPEEPAADELTEWAAEEGWADCWELAESACAVAARALDAADAEDLQYAATGVGRTLATWGRADHEQHFREIVLERTWDQSHGADSWRRVYNARLDVHHCVPGDVIGDRLASFGGGVLMSASLQPLPVFAETTGLRRLEAAGRPVESRTYGLSFPAENRASFAVDAPKYTYENRGDPGTPSRTRTTHLDAVVEVARRPGNVLVGMPNYVEAGWMADAVEDRIEKPVLLDESSADEVTESLKESFFAGDGKVLVTSLRGTLTEGVDYRGDRLSAAVVCGVPLVNTASPRIRAVRTAYDRVFDGNGFEYALTVPAVRKARQAIGRVVRGPEEVGVRVLVDARYARRSWDSVAEYLPDGEFQPVSPEFLRAGLDRFWDRHDG